MTRLHHSPVFRDQILIMDIDTQFPLDPSLCYLNHAAVAPWPKKTAEAIQTFAQENLLRGATDYPKWEETESELKAQLRTLINAPSADDIALVKNTSEGLSMIAYGLDWAEGDEIIISDQEFPSNRIVWESLAPLGVKVVEADLNSDRPETALIKLINNKTRLISISSVQYASGLKISLSEIGDACKQHNILFCVDAIQSLGAFQFDLNLTKADFVVADAHKWMLGPEGIALFYSRTDIRQTMRVNEYGWHMVDTMGDYDTREWHVDKSARRFECGSPNMLGIHGFHASLSLLLEIGLKEVEKRILENTGYLITQLEKINNCRIINSVEFERRSGIITFDIKGIDSHALKNALMENGVICAYRGGGIRFSPHFYTPKQTLDKALNELRRQIATL